MNDKLSHYTIHITLIHHEISPKCGLVTLIITLRRALTHIYVCAQGGRSKRRTHRGNKCKHTRARDVTRDNLAKNSL